MQNQNQNQLPPGQLGQTFTAAIEALGIVAQSWIQAEAFRTISAGQLAGRMNPTRPNKLLATLILEYISNRTDSVMKLEPLAQDTWTVSYTTTGTSPLTATPNQPQDTGIIQTYPAVQVDLAKLEARIVAKSHEKTLGVRALPAAKGFNSTN